MYEIKYRDMSEMIISGKICFNSIPLNWRLSKFKFISNMRIGNSINAADKDEKYSREFDEYYNYIGTKDLDRETNIITYENDLFIPLKNKFKIAKKESSLLCIEGGSAGKKLGYLDRDVCYGNKLCNITANETAISKYIYYFLQSRKFGEQINLKMNGIIPGISVEELKNIELILSVTTDQQKIANFLDIKTSQFDSIISKKEQLIQKLEEAKNSLISEVVTGKVKIDDGKLIKRNSSEMKGSGTEEFGLISREYKISKIKFHGDFKAGISKSAKYFGKGYPFVNYPDVYRNREISVASGLALTTAKEKIDFSIKKGDVFFTRTSETINDIGESCICKSCIKNGSYSGFIIRYRLREKDRTDYNYLKYYFQNSNVKKWFARQLNIVTRASLSQEKLKELLYILPSYEEQSIIGNYLEEKTKQIDNIINKTFNQINTFKQAKQSLISEAVTGKIDLRDWEIIEEGEMQ
jgi:type I restriction enzyme S subunit